MDRERVIGLVMTHGHDFYRQILRGVAEVANRRPHWRFVTAAPEIGRPVRELLRNVDGAIIGLSSSAWCRLAQRSRARIVNIDTVVANLPIPRIGVDNGVVGRLAAQHFLERGLRSFAYIGQREFLFSVERCLGFRAALAAGGHALRDYHSRLPNNFDQSGCAALLDAGSRRWLRSLPRPCGLLAANDALAADVIAACAEVGIRVPEEIAVLGVDDDDLYCRISRPRLSSVILPAEQIGRAAVGEIERLLQGRERFMTQDLLIPPSRIAVRRSTETLAVDDPQVVAAIRFVRENCHRPISVQDVMRVVELSRRTLERRVFEVLGTTLGAELRRTRLDAAKRLLAETDMPVTEVARLSGFGDFRQLAVSFKKALGQTPTQYRQDRSRSAARDLKGAAPELHAG